MFISEKHQFKKFENKVFRYLYNRDNQQNVSIYKGFAAQARILFSFLLYAVGISVGQAVRHWKMIGGTGDCFVNPNDKQ